MADGGEGFGGRCEVVALRRGTRRWPDDVTARIVAEGFQPGARGVDVARRHDLLVHRLSGWRRLAREGSACAPWEMMERQSSEAVANSGPVAVETEGPPPAGRSGVQWWQHRYPAGRRCRGGTGDRAGARGAGDDCRGPAAADRDRHAPGGFPARPLIRAATVRNGPGLDSHSGRTVILRSGRGDRPRILVRDGTGPVMVCRRPETGRLHLARGSGWGDAAVTGTVRAPV